MSGYSHQTRDRSLKTRLPLMGSTDDMIEGIHRRYEQFGVTYFVVPEDVVDILTPVVKRLVVCRSGGAFAVISEFDVFL